MSDPTNTSSVEKLPPPSLVSFASKREHIDRRATLRERILRFRQSLQSPHFVQAISQIEGANERVERLIGTIKSVSKELEAIPTISVALLGPSRHGKSTLLNALAGCQILPMSDIKPCTASIVSLKRDDHWDFRIRFITEQRLERERRTAVKDAKDYMRRVAKRTMGDEQPDDPRYLHSTLQRFIEVFGVDPDLSPAELVQAIETAEIPPNVKKHLGQSASPRSDNLDQMKGAVERYLSTKDIYWTIVNTCDISGPFENWHPNLELVDVPGTNDTDPHRTEITNSLRSKAKAVAICTSDSNLGNDIQSWLRNSNVLGDFLEATERSRQQLFILRTKFDSYHPEIDESQLPEGDEEAEEHAYRAAIANHKRQQTESYCEMFRNIASPLLPMGQSSEEVAKREEMIDRINGIRVFFVSALAYEAFEGRSKSTRRTVKRLKEHFHDDKSATGIPELRDFVNDMASNYLERFYFQDLERQLELEVDRLVRFFRQQWVTFEAEVSGGSKAIAALVERLEGEIIPWLHHFVGEECKKFEASSAVAQKKLDSMLKRVEQQLEAKLSYRVDKWNTFVWNSLKAMARKKGVHTTCTGQHIDVNQDISGLFVDDLSLSWTSFRDDVISASSDQIVDQIYHNMQEKLDAAAVEVDIPEATAAIDSIVTNLSSASRSQRDEFRRQVDESIHELESIRKPAYEAVQASMASVYERVANESGTGCQERMRRILAAGARSQLDEMWSQVREIVTLSIEGLLRRTSESLSQFGRSASKELVTTATDLKEFGKIANRERLLNQMDAIKLATRMLWDAVSEATEILVSLEPTRAESIVESTEHPILIEGPNAAATERLEADGIRPESNSKSDISSVEHFSQTPEASSDPETYPQEDMQDARVSSGDPGDSSIAVSLTRTELYQSQKKGTHRVDVDDILVSKIIAALEEHDWKLTVSALSEIIDMPTFRLRGVLPSIQRLMNVDGQQLLTICRSSDTAEMNESLLMQEFFS